MGYCVSLVIADKQVKSLYMLFVTLKHKILELK